MAYRTALAVIEGGDQGRGEMRDNDTRWGNLLIGERISWSDERSKQGWLSYAAVESRDCKNVYPKWKTLQTGITDPGGSLSVRDSQKLIIDR